MPHGGAGVEVDGDSWASAPSRAGRLTLLARGMAGPQVDAMSPGIPTLLGVPFDAASSFARGAAQAPPLLRAALRRDASNLWTEGLLDLGTPGCFADAGDVMLGADPHAATEAAVSRILAGGGRPT